MTNLIKISAMLFSTHLFNLQKWGPFFLRLAQFCEQLIFHKGTQKTAQGQESPQHEIPTTSVAPLSATYPLTWNEIHAKISEFIKIIDEKGVASLASRYNGDKHCDIIRRENGSFNICFFVHFPADNVRWVVRVPIVLVIQECQLKIQSEVATMLYVHNTLNG